MNKVHSLANPAPLAPEPCNFLNICPLFNKTILVSVFDRVCTQRGQWSKRRRWQWRSQFGYFAHITAFFLILSIFIVGRFPPDLLRLIFSNDAVLSTNKLTVPRLIAFEMLIFPPLLWTISTNDNNYYKQSTVKWLLAINANILLHVGKATFSAW